MSDNGNTPASVSGAVTPIMVQYLRDTRPWVFLLGVLGFIGVGFMVLLSVGMLIGSAMPPSDRSTTVTLMILGAGYFVMGALFFFPAYFLVRYGAAIGSLLRGEDGPALERALGYQKRFWRFMGMLTLVVFALGILLAVVTAFMAPAWLKYHG